LLPKPPGSIDPSTVSVEWGAQVPRADEQFWADLEGAQLLHLMDMSINNTLLCIHRDPAQLSLLKEKGYGLLTAANGHDGLQLFRSQSVDAIVIEYNQGHLDGAVVAAEIKQLRPDVPIVMLAEHAELPAGALNSVDVVVPKSDGPHHLWAAVHFVLNMKPVQRLNREVSVRARPRLGQRRARARQSELFALALEKENQPWSEEIWESVLDGTVQF
jgi:CheY-like chemotaxis protein